MNISRVIMLSMILAFLAGCATTGPSFRVHVDSINNPEAQSGNTYVLLSADKDISESDLHFKEFASYVNRVLASRGMRETSNFDEADMAIFLVYGIEEPQEQQYSYSVPIWGQTGVSSSTTYGTVSSYGGGYGIYSGTTSYTPTYGVTGYSSHTGNLVTFFRYMFLDAYDLATYRNTEKEVQAWKLKVTSTGTSGDIRQVFPVLVAASKDYLGTNTGKRISVNLHETDDAVLEVKGIVDTQGAEK